MRRRDFTKLALASAVGTVAAPAVVRAQTTFNWKMTSFYGPNAAFYSTGPGSAKDLMQAHRGHVGRAHQDPVLRRGRADPRRRRFRRGVRRHGRDELRQLLFLDRQELRRAVLHRRAVRPQLPGLQRLDTTTAAALELWREVYDRFNLVPFLCGNTGVQMTGWFKKPIEKVDDLKGLKMRIPGLAGRVYQRARRRRRACSPPGEIFPALERGVIDAAEFVGPYPRPPARPAQAAKYYYTTGWHETATASELIINKAKWNSLPPDLKAIVENACAACNVISEAWCQKNNAEAMEDLIKNQGVIAQPLPDDVVTALRAANDEDSRRGRRKGPGHQEGARLLHGLHGQVRSLGRPTAKPSTTTRSSRPDVTPAEKLADGIDPFIDARRPHHRLVVARARARDGRQRAAALRLQYRLGLVAGARVAPDGADLPVRHVLRAADTASMCASTCCSPHFLSATSIWSSSSRRCSAMAISLIVIWLSWAYVLQSWSIGEGTANPGRHPGRYILKAPDSRSGSRLLFLQSLAQAIQYLPRVARRAR